MVIFPQSHCNPQFDSQALAAGIRAHGGEVEWRGGDGDEPAELMGVIQRAATIVMLLIAAGEPPSFSATSQRAPISFGTTGAPLQYVVLGDSTAAGVGGTYENGIAMTTGRALGAQNTVTMTNLAVSGARVLDVRLTQLPHAASLRPDIVLLSAGANDVTHLTSIRSMRNDLREIVRVLREANSDVKIVITGSPDMGSPPRVPLLLRGIASWRTKRVNTMFIAEAKKLKLTFAPIAAVTGPMFRRDRSLFAEDRFHPNDRGYATWIPVLSEALAEALR